MKKMRLFTRIIPCLLVIVCVFALASCKKNNKTTNTTYPSVSPVIKNADDAFLEVGGYKVTNKSAYYRLLNSYGLDELNDWIDKMWLEEANKYDAKYTNEEFESNLKEIIYGEEEENAETLKEFEAEMRALGYFSEEAYKAYYALEYKRMAYAVKQHKEENPKDSYTEEEYEEFFKSLNRPTYNAIIVAFDSIAHANEELKAQGVVVNAFGEWVKDGASLTEATLVKTFEELYEAVTKKADASKTYTYAELAEVSSTLANKVDSLEVVSTDATKLNASYTHAPVASGSRYFLIVKTGETATKEYSEAEKDALYHSMIENEMSEAIITAAINKKHAEFELKIYDQGLETKYQNAYNGAYSALGITEYDAFKTTTEESDSVVAQVKIGGEVKKLTADELFASLKAKYGSILTLLLLQQYTVLKDNAVYSIEEAKILDQEKYDKYYETAIKEYKESFEKGTYEKNGYPVSYGWNNFLKDYLGVLDEKELIINLDSALYTDATAKLSEAVWTEVVEEEGEKVIKDDKVQAEMQNIKEAYFNATIVGVMAYKADNLTGKAVSFDEGVDSDSEAEALVNLIYDEAKNIVNNSTYTKKTFASALNEVLVIYNNANSANGTWGIYKEKGYVVKTINTTYTNASDINETLKAEIKTLWDKVSAYDEVKNEAGDTIGTKITGQNLDPYYRYTKSIGDPKETKAFFVSFDDFTSDVFYTSQEGDELSTTYKVSITKATAPSYTNSTDKLVEISYKEYSDYKSSGTSSKSSAIKAFYEAAISNLLKVDNVENAKTMDIILKQVDELLASAKLNGATATEVKALVNDNLTEK